MPKARAPLDYDRYQELQSQGLSQRQIAKVLGIAESTLRDNLRMMQKAQASHGLPQDGQGPPQGDRGTPQASSHWASQGDLELPQGPPAESPTPPEGLPRGDLRIPNLESSEVHQSTPDVSRTGLPAEDHSTPPLYIHPGIPDSCEESPVGGEDIEGVHEGVPTLPLAGIHEGDQGPPGAGLSPQLVEALTTAWPDLHRMLDWWQARQRLVQDAAAPERQLERQTYHIEKRFIEAVRREADLTGESYAAIVNRAFAQYFSGKST